MICASRSASQAPPLAQKRVTAPLVVVVILLLSLPSYGETPTPTTPTATPRPTATAPRPTATEGYSGQGYCGDGVVLPGEVCDDGGTCVGGPNAGMKCPANVPQIPGGVDCGTGSCLPFGGDGCAADCTPEKVVTSGFSPVYESIVLPTSTSIFLSGRMTFALSQNGLVAVRSLDFDTQLVSFGGYVCTRGIVSPEQFGPGNVGVGMLGGADTSLNILRITFAEQRWSGSSDRGADGVPCTDDDPGLHDAQVYDRQLWLSLPPTPACNGDRNGDGTVTIDEILDAVNKALNGCPPPKVP